MAFVLPALPFDKTAFGDIMSAETFDYHHGKHHNAYVGKANDMVKGTDLEGASLSKVIVAAKDKGNKGLFNNAAQIWNHTFFWHCLSPDQQTIPGSLEERINADFGSVAEMKDKLKTEAVGHFGSGWAWLVLNGDKLEITSLHDADSPVAHDGMKPLLTLDVWEHAYYIDYRNARPDYLSTVLDKAINWEFVAQNLDGKGTDRADQEG
ncbi:superoxide dismutase [Blastomonas aquatica]|uniref:Superoxide dismutase n=1 Tax=Blastomonas aquatica TaxID=1510276 RepID=A0ABQ1J208_9SPHN|nr:superoxide dismutase [Blastomonas aquatica]GGB58088.1 superoxide dismutase [Blastomonas aquatica]